MQSPRDHSACSDESAISAVRKHRELDRNVHSLPLGFGEPLVQSGQLCQVQVLGLQPLSVVSSFSLGDGSHDFPDFGLDQSAAEAFVDLIVGDGRVGNQAA